MVTLVKIMKKAKSERASSNVIFYLDNDRLMTLASLHVVFCNAYNCIHVLVACSMKLNLRLYFGCRM